MQFDNFIKDALKSTSDSKIYTIEIDDYSCEIIKKKTKLNIYNYKFIIEEGYIRHIKNRHKEDLYLLYKIPEILNKFDNVEKSLTKNKQTGQNEVSLVFRKRFDDGIVRMVAIRILKGKILSLKTFFRE